MGMWWWSAVVGLVCTSTYSHWITRQEVQGFQLIITLANVQALELPSIWQRLVTM